ncbi:5-oxoprolinase subunit C family protein [Basilea psittacipulmonis]|uniref:Carboxyltransferase domain-containing protein n=1 Tax=Basilea psittacipulmonis DSM 24701 TaxID=1072685 RepID=A0A077DB96_9BURK|nr:biotin-dependent carboxyltransferase family protein [Basilea psittacipulmonis]AIL32135.1 hypothetical protein IX83_01275 [Basilea psittacipulmonis DSM 24701]
MIEVIKHGILSTVQDEGRYGYQHIGVPVCGAMDKSAARIANLLLGNNKNDAVLEMALMGATLRFTTHTYIVLSGTKWPAFLDDQPITSLRPYFVKAGQVLRFGSPLEGGQPHTNIAYLAVLGGVQTPIIMGSRSCDMKNKLGQAPLKNGDVLPILPIKAPSNRLHKDIEQFKIYIESNLGNQKKRTIRVMKGWHWDKLSSSSQEDFIHSTYVVTPASNRMGFRLEGQKLTLTEPINMLSESTVFGTIQLPPAGQPIVLMADRQTTGGYPKIANVIWADLGYIAQIPPNASIQFELCSLEKAHELYLDRKEKWKKLEQSLTPMKELQELVIR